MKIELIQPFINSADAVLAEVLQCQTRIGDVNMEEDSYRRKGVAAQVEISGDIEGRVIFDMDPATAINIAAPTATPVSSVPEPAIITLTLSGLVALFAWKHRGKGCSKS